MKSIYKKILIYSFLILIGKIYTQNNSDITNNSWLFKSMTTITKGKREKISILYQDKNNFETLTFKNPDVLEYYIINDGIEHNGLAKWYLNGQSLTIISGKDTINSIIKIKNSSLNIITQDLDPETNFDFTTIIKYKNKIKKSN